MRVDINPRHADISPGQPQPITITITNNSTVIGGYALRVLGADPGWVQLDAEQLSLFPDESRTVVAIITAPQGIPAGSRRLAIQVRELTPPEASTITELDLTVPAAKSVQVRVDPLAVTAGRRAAFSVIVENTGNTVVRGHLAGDDPESKVRFEFLPEALELAPGEHALIDMRASARRGLAGSPRIRTLGLHLDQDSADPFFDRRDPDHAPPRDDQDSLAHATFVQKPMLSRGPLSLLGLLAAVTVFAIVITVAMSRLVGQSTADRDLALQIAAAQNASGTGGSSAVAGTVHLLTSGKPVPAVSVSLFSASDTANPVATTATGSDGSYRVDNLAAGAYKISFRGSGFVQLWYPGATTDADATTVTLAENVRKTGLNVTLGGVPAAISGTVVGDDVSAATLYLESIDAAAGRSTATVAQSAVPNGAAAPPDNGDAIVQSVPIGADGTFELANVPSPSVYDLVVTKTGYATSTQRIDVGAGETRRGVQLRLSKGDGLISGTITSASGPLGDVTVTATSGQSSVTTVSLSDAGTFTLRGLPTPATFTVQASVEGYASQTQTLTLAAGEKLTGVAITLPKSSGTLQGLVNLLPSNTPAPGVAVTVTDGLVVVQTESESLQSTAGGDQEVGHWRVGGLPVPGTYTVTFSRPDLAAQTVSVSLDAAGNVTPGSQGAAIDSNGRIVVGMSSATAVVEGVVRQHTSADAGSSTVPVGEVTVQLSSGTFSYQVTTASVPKSERGHFRIESIPPGTWTVSVSRPGTSPTSTILTLRAGDVRGYRPVLAAPASITGTVIGSDSTPRSHWVVQLYVASYYPNVINYSTTTDAQGNYSFPDVDAPQAYVIVTRPTTGSAEALSKTIQIEASQHLFVPLVADPNG